MFLCSKIYRRPSKECPEHNKIVLKIFAWNSEFWIELKKFFCTVIDSILRSKFFSLFQKLIGICFTKLVWTVLIHLLCFLMRNVISVYIATEILYFSLPRRKRLWLLVKRRNFYLAFLSNYRNYYCQIFFPRYISRLANCNILDCQIIFHSRNCCFINSVSDIYLSNNVEMFHYNFNLVSLMIISL